MLHQLQRNVSQSDHGRFVREWLRAPLRTGAIAPSSKALAREMIFAAATRSGDRVVELGPGTGVFTDALIEAGIDERALTLVELNTEFAHALRERLPTSTVMTKDALSALEELTRQKIPVDSVVSGLPLLSFPKEFRTEICKKALGLVRTHGRFVQFTYSMVSPVPIEHEIRATRSRRIWGNLPPAVVWTYPLDAANNASAVTLSDSD